MKLELTSVISASPLNDDRRLCTKLEAKDEAGATLMVQLLDDRNDLPELTNTKPNERGEWLAVFTKPGLEKPVDAFYIGDEAVLVNDEERFCIDVSSLEARTDAEAARKIITATFEQLIKPMITPAHASVVLSEKLALAQWLIESGLVHLANGSEYRVTRPSFQNINIERIYKVTDQQLTVKQTLLTVQAGQGLRQTKMYKQDEHCLTTFAELADRTNPYAMPQMFDNKAITTQYEGVEIKHPHILQQVSMFVQAGYSKGFILSFIKESDSVLLKHTQNTPHNNFPPMTGQYMQPNIPQMDAPMPMGHPTMLPNGYGAVGNCYSSFK